MYGSMHMWSHASPEKAWFPFHWHCYLWIKIKILPLPKSNTSSCKNISKTLLFPIVSSKYLSYACSKSMVLPDGIDAGVTSYLNKGKSKISFM